MSLIDISAVVKDYRGLRPLRIDRLVVNASEQVAILGLDQPSTEVLIAVITGAAIPDRGEVTVFGRSTASIADSDEWLSIADRFGIVSERTVLLEAFSVVQNLAVPFSLEIEPPSEAVRERASALAEEVGLPPGSTFTLPLIFLRFAQVVEWFSSLPRKKPDEVGFEPTLPLRVKLI